MQALLAVGLGGALGSVARYGVNSLAVQSAFPWATVVVNLLGSFAMGFLAVYLAARFVDQSALRLFLLTGVLGGFTTFSAFSLDTVNLIERGADVAAFGYVAASVIGSLVFVFAGAFLARGFLA